MSGNSRRPDWMALTPDVLEEQRQEVRRQHAKPTTKPIALAALKTRLANSGSGMMALPHGARPAGRGWRTRRRYRQPMMNGDPHGRTILRGW